MVFSPLTQQLISALTQLPGVGPKSAQRMALHLLSRDHQQGLALADAIKQAMEQVGRCSKCRNFSETEVCHLCQQQNRDASLLCVVESPGDVLAIEQSSHFKGYYFLLLGHLSPIDGIGPKEIGADLFEQRLQQEPIKEVIIATGTTVEGEATAHYFSEIARRHQVVASRIAHGVPMGGDLEYVDSNTLGLALTGRKTIDF